DPAEAPQLPPGYSSKVKKVHSQGGYGSQGLSIVWGDSEQFEEEQSSSWVVWRGVSPAPPSVWVFLPQEKFTPVKYFSIDRVFRNESLDATHLAEFHQVEGVVADRGLTLGHLMGTLRQFFTKLGISQLRFKPAYNPYTEPSMEVFSYHEGLKKWVEVGNSGVFRP
ncbi:SYFA ligase, partial [Malurus elegans]|nr:SYFA ligase [Malurus elegans]